MLNMNRISNWFRTQVIGNKTSGEKSTHIKQKNLIPEKHLPNRHYFQPYSYLAVILVAVTLFACSLDEDSLTGSNPSSDLELVINEVSAKGEDWIEIFNPTTEAIQITGFLVYDGGHADAPYIFPSAQVPAMGFLVLHFNTNDPVPYNTAFGLSADGESVTLAESNYAEISSVMFPALGDGQTYARIPDGSGAWQVVENPTPGAPNGGAPAQHLFLNEVVSTGDPDWIEIYNSTGDDIDISGYFLYDGGSSDNKSVFPAGTIVPAGGFLAWDCDDVQTNFKLSSGGEDIFLENHDEELLDSIVFPAMNEGESYARIPDGGVWSVSSNPTKGSSNQE